MQPNAQNKSDNPEGLQVVSLDAPTEALLAVDEMREKFLRGLPSYPTWAVDLKAAFGQWLAHIETLKQESLGRSGIGSDAEAARRSYTLDEELPRRIAMAADACVRPMEATEQIGKWLSEHPKK